MKSVSEKDLMNVSSLIRTLHPLYEALSGLRLMTACGEKQLMSFQRGKLSASLKALIDICETKGNDHDTNHS